MENELYIKQQLIDSIKDNLYDIISSQSDRDELYLIDINEFAIHLTNLLWEILETVTVDVIAALVVEFIIRTKTTFDKEKLRISTKQIKLLMIAAISTYKSHKKKDIEKIVDEVFDKYSMNNNG